MAPSLRNRGPPAVQSVPQHLLSAVKRHRFSYDSEDSLPLIKLVPDDDLPLAKLAQKSIVYEQVQAVIVAYEADDYDLYIPTEYSNDVVLSATPLVQIECKQPGMLAMQQLGAPTAIPSELTGMVSCTRMETSNGTTFFFNTSLVRLFLSICFLVFVAYHILFVGRVSCEVRCLICINGQHSRPYSLGEAAQRSGVVSAGACRGSWLHGIPR